MSRPISSVKRHLLHYIQGISKNAWPFSAAPEKDFTRNRKLSFETMVKTLLCMEGGDLTSELMKLFGRCADIISATASDRTAKFYFNFLISHKISLSAGQNL